MLFATVGTNVLRYSTHLLNGVETIPMTRVFWAKTILPLGGLFSASLILSNIAYVHLSVSFIQILKVSLVPPLKSRTFAHSPVQALIPVVSLLVQFAAGTMTPNFALGIIIAVISIGCMIAAHGELAFSVIGFACQSVAVVVESVRLVMVQILLQDLKMDPLVSIYYYAPVCFVLISLCLPIMEGMAPFRALGDVGAMTLLANGIIAFSLNIAGVFLINSAGSLVLTLSGVFKVRKGLL
jgi:hypothetical protein